MRKFKKVSLLLVVLAFSAISFNCSSDSSSSNDSSTFFLKCKVNGTLIEFNDPMVINSLSKSITANNEDTGKVISLFLPLDVANGTFTITDEPSNVDSFGGSFSDFNEDVYTDNETGTMVITEVTADVIKGTFSFTGDDGNGGTITVTEGSFRAENIE